VNNFISRTITGAIFVMLIIASILLHPVFFASLFLVFCVLGTLEFYKIVASENIQPQKILGIIIAIYWYLSFTFIISFGLSIIFIIPLVFLVFIFELFRNKPNPILNIAVTLIGFLYIAFPLSLLNFIPIFLENHYELLLGIFVLTWTNDTFAYLTGIKLGKHKLFERISPKKTWEGSIGGLIFSLICACIFSYFYKDSSILVWIGMAIIIVITGILGDLVESMFKRSLQIKDSGSILPGHGGILDRLDAMLIATPFVFVYLICLYYFQLIN